MLRRGPRRRTRGAAASPPPPALRRDTRSLPAGDRAAGGRPFRPGTLARREALQAEPAQTRALVADVARAATHLYRENHAMFSARAVGHRFRCARRSA